MPFVIKQNGRNVIPLRNGEFEVAIHGAGEIFISGRAVDALASYESYPKPDEDGFVFNPETGEPILVKVLSITYSFTGHSIVCRAIGESTTYEIKCLPGATWFKDYESAKAAREGCFA